MEYYIDYGTGAGNKYVEGTLEDAMRSADKGAAYTQCDIKIFVVPDDEPDEEERDEEEFDEDDDDFNKDFEDEYESRGINPNWVAVREWSDLPYDQSEDYDEDYGVPEDILDFGVYGYYGPWEELNWW